MDIEVINYVHNLGYTVAGFAEEIYEDAHIFIGPMFGFDLEKPEKHLYGRVLSVNSKYQSYDESDHYVVHFVLELPNGKQAPLAYGKGFPVFFMLPERVAALV
jgi:hypothetical protein